MIRTWLTTLVLLVSGMTFVGAPAHAANDTDWTTVDTGVEHTCGIRVGTLYCWGYDQDGKLGNGDGSGDDQDAPQQIGTKTDWKSVTAGVAHTCGIRGVGSLFCWGSDDDGRLGNGEVEDEPEDQDVPQRIGLRTDWKSVSAGSQHTCGIRSPGKLFCWGSDGDGKLGNGGGDEQEAPHRVGVQSDWTRVSAAQDHTCGIRAGKLFCWGSDNDERLGNGEGVEGTEAPQRIGTSIDWKSVTGGDNHTCGIRSPGKLFCWGSDGTGEVGNGPAGEQDVAVPQRIGTNTDWKTVNAGTNYTCGIGSGKLFCWGNDVDQRLGNGPGTGDQVTPQQIGMDTDWKSVSAGSYHTCGTRTTGKLFCWGGDYEGQLGNGPVDGSRDAPDQI